MSLVLLAAPVAHKSGEAAKAGPIGLAVIILLCVACYFLFKSMSKHLRNVRENFPDQDGQASAPSTGTTAGQPANEHVPPHRGEPGSG